MAVKNSATIVDNTGGIIAKDNIVICQVTSPAPYVQRNAEGIYTGEYTRKLQYRFLVYRSVQAFQNGDSYVSGIKSFKEDWEKFLTDQEYQDLRSNGDLAEIWAKDYIQSQIGGVSTLIDPTVIV